MAKKSGEGRGGWRVYYVLWLGAYILTGVIKMKFFFCKVTLKCRGAEEGAQISLTKKIIGGITLILMF